MFPIFVTFSLLQLQQKIAQVGAWGNYKIEIIPQKDEMTSGKNETKFFGFQKDLKFCIQHSLLYLSQGET